MRSFPGRGHLYDLAVVGAGVAGSEAAMAAARAGLDVLLVTTSLDTVYMLAHQRTVLEPARGTLMAELLPSLVGDDGSVERWALHRAGKYALEAQSGIHLLQSNVTELIATQSTSTQSNTTEPNTTEPITTEPISEGVRVEGVRTWEGVERSARRVALCVGSFLGARLEQGRLRESAGRLGEMAYDELFDDLQALGLTFDPAVLELADHGEGLPYRVSCNRLAEAERSAGEHFRLRRHEGLYAAGVCLDGVLPYEQAAVDGMRLGKALADQSQVPGPGDG